MRTRIVLSILLVAAVGLTASGVASYLVQREHVLAKVDAQLLHATEDLKTIAAGKTSATMPESVDSILRTAMQQIIPASNESTLGIIDSVPALLSAVKLPFRIDQDKALLSRVISEAHDTKVVIGTAKTDLRTTRYLIIPVHAAGDPSNGLFVVAVDLDAELDAVAQSFGTYVLVAIIAVILIGMVAAVVAGRLLRPIRLLKEAAAKSSTAADLTERIPVTGTDDVSELAAAINSMFDRLQASAASQRRLINDVGHELKTPITIIRGHLELLEVDSFTDVEATRALAIDELDRMSTLVSHIALLAESETSRFVEPAEVDIAALTAAVGSKAMALDPAREWLISSVDGVACFDSRRITQAWLQLADNAAKYSTPGETIVISSDVWKAHTGSWLSLSVRDSGPGIPRESQQVIFERFERLEANRELDGSGLGLSIVTAIAQAHGGWVQLASDQGESTTFTIHVPLDMQAEKVTAERRD